MILGPCWDQVLTGVGIRFSNFSTHVQMAASRQTKMHSDVLASNFHLRFPPLAASGIYIYICISVFVACFVFLSFLRLVVGCLLGLVFVDCGTILASIWDPVGVDLGINIEVGISMVFWMGPRGSWGGPES